MFFSCSYISLCFFSLSCQFDTNNDPSDGCEEGCAVVPGGTCTTCTSIAASGCTSVTCTKNKFDTNNDATDGCEDVSICAFVFSDDASLSATNGYNVLSKSCFMTSQISIGSGKTLKIKKSETVVGEIIIDREATKLSPGKHFYMNGGGALEVEGVTLTGGYHNYGGVVYVNSGSSASFKNCIISGNTGGSYVSWHFEISLEYILFESSFMVFLVFFKCKNNLYILYRADICLKNFHLLYSIFLSFLGWCGLP